MWFKWKFANWYNGPGTSFYCRNVGRRVKNVTGGMKKGETSQGLTIYCAFHHFLVEFLQLVLLMKITSLVFKFHPWLRVVQ